jgi:hypothetical protein
MPKTNKIPMRLMFMLINIPYLHACLVNPGYGTGSKPPGLNGLQRSTRQIAIIVPLIAPCL